MSRSDVLPDLNNVAASTHIVRHPIYDANVKVNGYELIVHGDAGQDDAAGTAGAVMQIGLNIVAGGLAWVPLTRGLLFGGYAEALPPDRVVFQVDPVLGSDSRALAAIRQLKKDDFQFAIDPLTEVLGVSQIEETAELLQVADGVKIDATQDRATLANLVALGRRANTRTLAKNVETHETFEMCKALGFDLFEGYFFCQPRAVENNKPLEVNNLNNMRLVAELRDPGVDMDTLGEIVARDVGLSYNLLRFINSAFFSLPRRIESIKDALVLLGLQNVKRWASLMALAQGNDKPHELIVTGLVRARMAELVAIARGDREESDVYFTVGLFSVVDALMDRSMIDVLRQLPFSQEVMEALLNYGGPKGELLHGILTYERGDFDPLLALMPAGTPPADFYAQAVSWATDAIGGLVAVPNAA